MKTDPVLIIGAGPAGLAMAGRLKQLNVPFTLLESSHRISDSWHHHYDRLRLHTVKEYSHLPHMPFPQNYPRYVSRRQVVAYYQSYANKFEIKPIFGITVRNIKRINDECWEVLTDVGKTFWSRNVVVATGVNRVPHVPHFAGEEEFTGKKLHSQRYKNGTPFQGRSVLVIGMGNSGAEIALDLCEHGAQSYISVRSAVNIVPRDIFGRPTQLTAIKLAHLPNWLADTISVVVRKITVGDLSKYGLATPKMPLSKQLRVTGKTPVIDVGTLAKIRAGKIEIVPEVERFTSTGVICRNGPTINLDAVIFATGYKPLLEEIIPGIEATLDANGAPIRKIGTGQFEGLYFLGFDNYSPGGILRSIFLDSEVLAHHIQRQFL